jgi:hypothetical protein
MDAQAQIDHVEGVEPVVEELERDCCLRLLATGTVGRLAVAQPGGAPYLVPVNSTMLLRDLVSQARMSE